jgi:flagellar biosynthesis GTPase FlhF
MKMFFSRGGNIFFSASSAIMDQGNETAEKKVEDLRVDEEIL